MRTVALGDHVEILSGFAFKSERFNEDGRGLPLVRIRDVKPATSQTYYEGEYDGRFVLSDGDLLVGMDGEFNCARWAGGQALLNQRVCRVRAVSKFLDEQYLFWYLPKALKDIEQKSNFVTVKHLSGKQINEIKIPLPSMEEQKRIAAILDQADDLRRKRQRALDRLNQLGQAVFIEKFGGQDQHSTKAISDFAEVKGGKRLPKGSDYVNGVTPHPYIRVSDLDGVGVDTQDLKYISQDTHAAVRRYIVHCTDVIISIAGTIGVTATVPISLDGANLTENAAKITPKSGAQFNPTYVAWALRAPSARSQIQASTGQVTIGKLALFRIEKIVIPMPDLPTQNRFAQIIAALDAEVATQRLSLMHAEHLFASLQHLAFHGER